MFPYYMDKYWFIFVLPAMILAMLAQSKIKNSYQKYSRIDNGTGYTGAEIARMILDNNGLQNVTIRPSNGVLSDHYDPRNKTVNLSPHVYSGKSVSSMGIAAHEVGHAIQHATEYTPLVIRSAIVPVVNFASQFVMIFVMAGLIFARPGLTRLGIGMFLATVIFQVVTLPVEFNASRRALKQLETGHIASEQKIDESKEVLTAAALTYVASTLVAIGQLLRLLAITQNNRNEN